jgi:hypothetical protein
VSWHQNSDVPVSIVGWGAWRLPLRQHNGGKNFYKEDENGNGYKKGHDRQGK